MAGQLTHNKTVATHRVQSVDQLPPGHAVAHASPPARSELQRFLVALEPLWAASTTKFQWHLESSSTFLQERQVEAEEIVIFNDIGIALANHLAEFGNETRLLIG